MPYGERGGFMDAVQEHIGRVSRSSPAGEEPEDARADSWLARIFPWAGRRRADNEPLSQAARAEVQRLVSEGTTRELRERLSKELRNLTSLAESQNDRLQSLRQQREKMLDRSRQTHTAVEESRASLKMLADPKQTALLLKRTQAQEEMALLAELLERREMNKAEHLRSVRSIEQKILECERNVAKLGGELQVLRSERDAGPALSALQRLDSGTLQVVGSVVVMVNFLTMLLELRFKELDFTLVDSLFLLFFVAELAMNLILQGRGFLVGRPSVVCWNWADLLAVIGGFAELVLRLAGVEGGWLKVPRLLRLVRLVRLTKLARQFATADISWADTQEFQSAMGAVIGVNTILMGLELTYEGLAIWAFLESVLLMIYVFELLVRVRRRRCRFFCSSDGGDVLWNWLDLVIVLGGVFDMWVTPVVNEVSAAMGGEQHDSQVSSVLSLMRIARLARLLRLVRLVRSIPPLYLLAVGIAEAMRGMFWVLVLTMGVLYICALLGVQLVGGGWALPSSLTAGEVREVKKTFDDVPYAVFNLFEAMNADLSGFGPLFHAMPGSKWIMMAFMIVTNWAIFSILTAVVSDNMAKVTEKSEREAEESEAAKANERWANKLELVFGRLDKDGDGAICITEARELFSDDVEMEMLCAVSGLEADDIRDIFELVADEGQGMITHTRYRELMQGGFSKVTGRNLLKFEAALNRIEGMFPKRVKNRIRRHTTM